ncbi:M4 family metallopeptidase [Polluticoccus soli]|uniref:M4 family metallopeptidase n=1 Tax=Polluticoccus soli TaxID=3034150 RepID=UPI0023E16B11|nr:M4 family metallopeptidase [Flavipsychrobacter sp. JY13-12]
MCKNHRNPIRCILPPYIAEKMKESEKLKLEDALNNELRDFRLRSDRKFFSTLAATERTVLAVKKAAAPKPKAVIQIHTVSKGYSLPGKLMTSAQIKKDKEARNVLKGVKATWDFYYDIFKRNSIDDAGMPLVNSIHYGKKYNNALWNGRQMVYGDGDKITFDSFTNDIDIIAHELAHGVTEYAANFDYENQPGALNESFSDVFGIMIKQYAMNEDVNQSNWLIGENIMLGKQYSLRSMASPGTAFTNHPQWGDDPQPATMKDFVVLPNTKDGDWGGVHYNSGIPNYAFCMAAKEIGGYAWETIGKVWYAALTQSLSADSDFKAAKKATISHAHQLFGKNSKVHKGVIAGWKAAKV